MINGRAILRLALFGLGIASLIFADNPVSQPTLPEPWREALSAPGVENRPMQIVHGYIDGIANTQSMTTLRQIGLGGIVCNVSFDQYMTSETHWATLTKAIEACKAAGLRVWIYDENGYPSAAAGGLVLKTDPAFEAQALAFDSTQPDPFVVRPSYENTHASNNFCAARRYPNLIDQTAIQCFIEKTHQAYWSRFEPYFGATIEAFFTDEPSLMAVNIGQLPKEAREKVPVVDALDPNFKPLQSVPWSADLAAQYKQRYNEDLMPVRRSLFEGDTDADRKTRQQFWALIADLTAERYFGQIQNWCKPHHIASSGHVLWEEDLLHHVPLDGNTLACLMKMDIPGLDVLSSNPAIAIHSAWLTATLPASAAMFNGGRRVMTEVSDFSEKFSGKGPAPLDKRLAAAAWQAAFGVTEFTLYYHYRQTMQDATDAPEELTWQQNKTYYDYVGRLNALLRPARQAPAVLLYYPIYDLWAEYKPVAEPLKLETQSPQAQQITNSFMRLGRQLTRSQIPFALADHNLLASAEIRDGAMWVKGYPFTAVILPADSTLPAQARQLIDRFKAAGGQVITDSHPTPLDTKPIAESAKLPTLNPASENIVLGRFIRDHHIIYILVNTADQPYNGALTITQPENALLADPATGQIKPAASSHAPTIDLQLAPDASIFIVIPEKQ